MGNVNVGVGDSYDATFPDDLFRDCVMSALGVTHPNTILTATVASASNVVICGLGGVTEIASIEGVGSLTGLRGLYVRAKNLSNIPSEIENLTNLTLLTITDSTLLTSVPDEVGVLTNLTEMYFSNNQLTSLPTTIGNLTNLTDLGADGNQFPSLPTGITQLTNLAYLAINNNLLETGSGITLGANTFTVAVSQQLSVTADSEQTFTGQLGFAIQAVPASATTYPLAISGGRAVSSAHFFSFEDVRDENGIVVSLSDYVDAKTEC